jgi:hypothetical protein
MRFASFPGFWACLMFTGLTACGGADDGGPTTAANTGIAAAERTELLGPASVVAPLLDNDGTVAAGAAEPADAGARTRAGRYASAAQARQLAEALGPDAIEIEVGCCSADAVEQAVGITWGLQAARDLPPQTPVLVRGQDLRLAAAAANRLADGGLTHVWLVTP